MSQVYDGRGTPCWSQVTRLVRPHRHHHRSSAPSTPVIQPTRASRPRTIRAFLCTRAAFADARGRGWRL